MEKREHDRQSRAPEAIILVVGLIIVLAIGFFSNASTQDARRAADALSTARGIINLNNELLSTLKDAETGQRGFLLTGEEKYLDPYKEAVSRTPGLLGQLDNITAREPALNRRVQDLQPLVPAKLNELKETIDLKRSGGTAPAVAIVNTDRGKTIMDLIRMRSALVNQIAEQRLSEATSAADRSSARLRIVVAAGSALLFGFLIISALTIFRSLNRRDELFAQAFESARKLEVILTSIADGVIATDAAAKITFINPVAEALTGWTSRDCAGRHIKEIFRIINETTRETVTNPLEQAMAEGRAVGLANHTKLIARDGSQTFIDDSAAPIRNESGIITGAVLVFRDISERRRAEQAMAQSTLVLQRSNEELQHFAFAASHDLRSPLRSVNTMAQLLAKQFGEKLDHDGNRMIGYIADGAARMTRLIDDLLALARDTGAGPESDELTSVQSALEIVRASLGAEITEAGATVTSSALPRVAARDTHVAVVLQNLIGNALKYRGPAPPNIHVSAEQQNGQWIVAVKDNGIGIDPAHSEQIFQPFKRLHGDEYEGTGIGLWTCKKIVSGYGGRIWVESAPGAGSTFRFSLPAAGAAHLQ